MWKFSLWRHGDEEGVKRESAVNRLDEMLQGLIAAAAKKRMKLAPFIGIGCPGVIEADGSIDRGAENLPGNWESSKFNLPVSIHEMIPQIGDQETSIVLHNDAVVQGLSEIPYMKDVERWGILTIGTGLGNARFSNRETNGTSSSKLTLGLHGMWLNCRIQNSSGIARNSRVQTRLSFQVTVFARPNSRLRPVRFEVQRSGGCTFFLRAGARCGDIRCPG